MAKDILQALTDGCEKLQLSLSARQLEKLTELQTQLIKWNQAFNLTAITEPLEVLQLHLLDSLAIVPFWPYRKTLDVGTGAGFPGLPLAIALPQQEFHLLDSNSKKIRFIRQQIHQLGLDNVTAFHCRVEQHQPQGYQAIVSRAFASLVDMIESSKHLLADGGSWMAMKGIYQASEVASLPAEYQQVAWHQLNVPGLQADRCLIEVRRRNH